MSHISGNLRDPDSSITDGVQLEDVWLNKAKVLAGKNCKLTRCMFSRGTYKLGDNVELTDCVFDGDSVICSDVKISGARMIHTTVEGSGTLDIQSKYPENDVYVASTMTIAESRIILHGKSCIRNVRKIYGSYLELGDNTLISSVVRTRYDESEGYRVRPTLKICATRIEAGDRSVVLYMGYCYSSTIDSYITSMKLGKDSTLALKGVFGTWTKQEDPIIVGDHSKLIVSQIEPTSITCTDHCFVEPYGDRAVRSIFYRSYRAYGTYCHGSQWRCPIAVKEPYTVIVGGKRVN